MTRSFAHHHQLWLVVFQVVLMQSRQKRRLMRRHTLEFGMEPSTEPLTGILYTPPTYSDHVPVSVFFRMTRLQPTGNETPLVPVAEARRCQPWSSQRSLASFFAKPATASSTGRKRKL